MQWFSNARLRSLDLVLKARGNHFLIGLFQGSNPISHVSERPYWQLCEEEQWVEGRGTE